MQNQLPRAKRMLKRALQIFPGIAFFFVLAVALPENVSAQKGSIVSKNVNFTKGSSSAIFKGSAAWGTAYVYQLRAKAGQRMTISISGVPAFSLMLKVPPEADGEQPDGETRDVKSWSGILNDSGIYEIRVSHTKDGVEHAPYTLKISIK